MSLFEERAWSRVSSFTSLGGLLVAAGVLMAAAPWSTMPAELTHGWWVTFVSFPEAIRAAAVLIAFAAVVALGALVPRLTRGADKMLSTGLSLMILASLLGLISWSMGFMGPPVTRVSLPLQQTVQSVPAIKTTGTLKMMLPQSLTVTELDPRGATAKIKLAGVGEEGDTISLMSGQPVRLANHRLTLLGVEFDPRIPRVIVSSGEKDTIASGAMQGQSLQLKVDGPKFKVLRIARNYLGVMGAAVELENEKLGKFWLYERGAIHGDELTVPGRLRLDRIESAPVAVLALSSDEGGQLLGASGLVFVLGLGLLFAAPLSSAPVGRSRFSEEEE